MTHDAHAPERGPTPTTPLDRLLAAGNKLAFAASGMTDRPEQLLWACQWEQALSEIGRDNPSAAGILRGIR